jgi:hypothetical protein
MVIDRADAYAQAVANAFQKKTGVHVEVAHLSTGPPIAKIEAEKDNPLRQRPRRPQQSHSGATPPRELGAVQGSMCLPQS